MPKRVMELSEQQKNCLRLVHQGRTSKEIAQILGTSFGTVDNHVSAAMVKLGVTGRREAARILSEFENGGVQRLHMQSEPIAETIIPPDEIDQDERRHGFMPHLKWAFGALFTLPPMGGPENDLTRVSRSITILRIALFGAVMLIAIVTIAVGTIQLLI